MLTAICSSGGSWRPIRSLALLALLASSAPLLANDGGYDPNFALGGRRLVDVSGVDELFGMQLRPNRRLLLSGNCAGNDSGGGSVAALCVAELSPSGLLTGYGPVGSSVGIGRLLLTDLLPQAPGEDYDGAASTMDAEGRLIIVGTHSFSSSEAFLLRTASDGRSVESPYFRPLEAGDIPVARYTSVAIDSDQRIVAAAYVRTTAGTTDLVLTRFNSALQPDPSFATQGSARVSMAGIQILPVDIAIDSLGRIVVLSNRNPVGPGDTQTLVARFSPNGSLDSSFGTGGLVLLIGPSSTANTGLTVDSSDRILILSSYFQSSEADLDLLLTRLTASGSPDPTIPASGGFNAGFRSYQLEDLVSVGANEISADLMVQPDGHIVIVGAVQRLTGNQRFFLSMRVLDNADLDPSYGVNGVSVGSFEGAPFTGANDMAKALALDPAGFLLVGGIAIGSDLMATEDFGVARLVNRAVAGIPLLEDGFE